MSSSSTSTKGSDYTITDLKVEGFNGGVAGFTGKITLGSGGDGGGGSSSGTDPVATAQAELYNAQTAYDAAIRAAMIEHEKNKPSDRKNEYGVNAYLKADKQPSIQFLTDELTKLPSTLTAPTPFQTLVAQFGAAKTKLKEAEAKLDAAKAAAKKGGGRSRMVGGAIDVNALKNAVAKASNAADRAASAKTPENAAAAAADAKNAANSASAAVDTSSNNGNNGNNSNNSNNGSNGSNVGNYENNGTMPTNDNGVNNGNNGSNGSNVGNYENNGTIPTNDNSGNGVNNGSNGSNLPNNGSNVGNYENNGTMPSNNSGSNQRRRRGGVRLTHRRRTLRHRRSTRKH